MDYINDHLSAQANDHALSPAIKASRASEKRPWTVLLAYWFVGGVLVLQWVGIWPSGFSYMSNSFLDSPSPPITNYHTSSLPSGNRSGLTRWGSGTWTNLNVLTTEDLCNPRDAIHTTEVWELLQCCLLGWLTADSIIEKATECLWWTFIPSFDPPPKGSSWQTSPLPSTDLEGVDDVLMLVERTFGDVSLLLRMELDYLTIPGMSILFTHSQHVYSVFL